jgi:hypothetical protein
MSSPQQPPPPGARTYYPYSVPLILTLAGAYLVLWPIVLAGGANTSAMLSTVIGRIAASLFIAVLATAAFLDWRGLLSMRGLVDWSRIHGGKRVALICAFVFGFAIVLGIYLVRAALVAWDTRPSGQMPPIASAAPVASTVTARLRTPTGGFVTLGIVFVFALLLYSFGNVGAAAGSQTHTASQNTSNTGGSQHTVADTSVAATATAIPQPTATVAPTATATKAPPCADPCNPWGYNFKSGKLIYSPPGAFCGYFNCIPSFWKSTNGYVEECSDATFSHSGGVQGSCSYHGGNWRPLYSH